MLPNDASSPRLGLLALEARPPRRRRKRGRQPLEIGHRADEELLARLVIVEDDRRRDDARRGTHLR